MTENQKDTRKGCHDFFENMPFARMIKKMTDSKGACCDFSCSEIMSQLMKMCGKGQTGKEEAAKEAKDANRTTS